MHALPLLCISFCSQSHMTTGILIVSSFIFLLLGKYGVYLAIMSFCSAQGMILKKRRGMCKRYVLEAHPKQLQMLKVVHLIEVVVVDHGGRSGDRMATRAPKDQKPLDQTDSIDNCEPHVWRESWDIWSSYTMMSSRFRFGLGILQNGTHSNYFQELGVYLQEGIPYGWKPWCKWWVIPGPKEISSCWFLWQFVNGYKPELTKLKVWSLEGLLFWGNHLLIKKKKREKKENILFSII